MTEPKHAKPRYKTTNWKAYNSALKARGSLTMWLDRDMQWYAPASGKRGRQQIFSDRAIEFCLSIKCLFGLAFGKAWVWCTACCAWRGWTGGFWTSAR